ncbi:MAG: dihydrofolate reductase [Desulfamplus sp.]|nr:dihydrofolate reductase [Desulfamplus sp.]
MKVILVMAMTLDGKIARHSMEPVNWTGKADKRKFVKITKEAGAVIMGSTTFDTIGKILPDRKNIVMTRNPIRLAIDSNHSGTVQNLNRNSRTTGNGILEFTDKSPEEILKSLEKEGFESAALIGGSIINGLFAKENLIDEVYITLVPKLFGQGLSLFAADFDINLELSEMEKIDENSILLKYNVIK